jgi:hypothetical protein
MPQWMKDSLQKDDLFRSQLLEKGSGIAQFLEENPREILGLSGGEKNARDLLWDDYDEAEGRAKALMAGLGGGNEDRYTDDVVATTLAGMQRQADRDRLAREGQAAAVGGLSNTRAAVADAVAGQLSGMNMAEMEAKLRSEGLRWGQEQDLAETGLADQISSGIFNRGVTTAGALGGIAEQERVLEQAKLDAERDAGKDSLGWLSSLFSGTQYDKGPVGSTATSTQPKPSTFQTILGTAASLGGAWLQSDEDVKEDITPVEGSALDRLRDLRVVEYNYKPGYGHTDGRTTGLIAQDLEKAGITGAVRARDGDGVKEVDPYAVLATVVGAVQQLAHERAA